MSDHYYTRKPTAQSDPVYWDNNLRNHAFRFKTDSGVFSKREIDFGSRLLAETFEFPDETGLILDVGCGYGPIGLSLAKSYPKATVHMVDINERALELAKDNASLNDIQNVRIYGSDRLENVEEAGFRAIVTNPPIRAGKKVVYEIFEESFSHLLPEGELWVVIQKKQGAPSAVAKLEQIFSKVKIIEKKKGYFIVKATK